MTVDTGPYSSKVLALLTGPFATDYAVTAYVKGRSGGFSLKPTAIRVVFDQRRAPRVTGTVTVALPSKATRSALDPRNNVTLDIAAGYRLLTGKITSARLAKLRAQQVTRDLIANTLTFELAGDEIVVIDYPFDAAATVGTANVTTKVAAIKNTVEACFPGETITWTVDPKVDKDSTFNTTQASKYGDDRWEAVNDWAESLSAKVYSDGNNRWSIDRPDTVATASVRARLRTGPAGTVSALTVTDTRDGSWANRILLQYVSRSGSTTTTTTVIAKTSLTPPRLKIVKRNRPVEDGRAVARHILKRALRRTHQVTFTAPAHFWLRPGHSVTVDDPDVGQHRVLLEQIDFDVCAGTMRVLARQAPTGGDAAVVIDTYDETTT